MHDVLYLQVWAKFSIRDTLGCLENQKVLEKSKATSIIIARGMADARAIRFDALNEAHMRHLHALMQRMHAYLTCMQNTSGSGEEDVEIQRAAWRAYERTLHAAPYHIRSNIMSLQTDAFDIPARGDYFSRVVNEANTRIRVQMTLQSLYVDALETRTRARVQETLRVLRRRGLPMPLVTRIAQNVNENAF